MEPKRTLLIAAFAFFAACNSTAAAPQRPGMLPPGWTADERASANEPLRYRSPDGAAWISLFATPAQSPARQASLYGAARKGERVTYHRKTNRFVAVSGYVGDRIFYRKSNLACGGSRWHHIAMEYPAEEKREMDALVTRVAHGMNRYDDSCRDSASRGPRRR